MAIYDDKRITYDLQYAAAILQALRDSSDFLLTSQGYVDTNFPIGNHPTHFGRTVADLNGGVSSDKPKPLARVESGAVVFLNRASPVIRAAQKPLERVIRIAIREAMNGHLPTQ